MSEPSETPWDSYVAFVGEEPLLVDFETGAAEADLRVALPAVLRIQLEVVAPDERGQPCAMEERQLDHEQEGLGQLLAQHAPGARVVARATGRGGRELILALPAPGQADYALRKWGRKLERESEVTVLAEGWSFVDAHLLPGPGERDWMEARDAVLAAVEAGAEPGAPATLIITGHPPATVPLDPFAIAAEVTAARGSSPGVPQWHLE